MTTAERVSDGMSTQEWLEVREVLDRARLLLASLERAAVERGFTLNSGLADELMGYGLGIATKGEEFVGKAKAAAEVMRRIEEEDTP